MPSDSLMLSQSSKKMSTFVLLKRGAPCLILKRVAVDGLVVGVAVVAFEPFPPSMVNAYPCSILETFLYFLIPTISHLKQLKVALYLRLSNPNLIADDLPTIPNLKQLKVALMILNPITYALFS